MDKYNKVKKYNKLVRDKIPQHIKSLGKPCDYHIANDKEYWLKLKEKLIEEVNEFNKEESKDELADILEVIDAICKFKKYNKKEISKIQKQKRKERGSFNKRIILEKS
jgi:predicted house-cleaning noncanonical NTP pyrophosphatase (MazG superfamily)